MALRPLLRFQNPDSTQDLNDRARGLFNKGVFSGGTVEPITGTLAVRLGVFATVGFDGMFVREDDTSTTLSVAAGQKNYVVIRQKYIANNDPVTSLEVLTESEFLGDSEPDALITFATVEVPVAATEVTADMIDFTERDVVDPVGRLELRGRLTNVGDLPPGSLNSNRPGDFYIVTDGLGGFPELHAWNGVSWVNITQAQTLIAILEDHLDNLTDDRKHVTNQQEDALLGTVGTPSDSNRYVTSLDPRIPTQGENDALRGDFDTILSDSLSPSDTNRYVTAAKVVADPTEKTFLGSALIEILDAEGPVYVGKGTVGTAQVYFNIFDSDTTGQDSDKELVNGAFQSVRVTGVFTEASFTLELNPATNPNVDALGFYSGTSLFLAVDNPANVDFRISYGKRARFGDILPDIFIRRTPSSGQVDSEVARLLTSNVNAQFADSSWDAGISPGDVAAFVSGLGFVQHDTGLGRDPVGIRGNANNLIQEGLYVYPSATAFSAGDQVYADPVTPGALTTTTNDRFIGTFISSTELLVNMNAFAISASSFVPGISFPGSLFDPMLLPGEAASFNHITGEWEQWDSSNPNTPVPQGIRGNANNIIQVGLYTDAGAPYSAGQRLHGNTSTPGALTTTVNDFYIGLAISTNQLLVNCAGQRVWQSARTTFDIEHEDTTGTHKEGAARTFIGVATDAGATLSQSLASSTGMVLFATDTGQVFYCTNGAADTWVQASRFSGPLQINNSLTVGTGLTLSSGTFQLPGDLFDGVSDNMNVFAHAARHLASGEDTIPGIINQVFFDGETGPVALPGVGVFDVRLSVGIDFTGRPGLSSLLFFAVTNIQNDDSVNRDIQIRGALDGSPISVPQSSGTGQWEIPTGESGQLTAIGFLNNVTAAAHTLAIELAGSSTVDQRNSLLLALDLGPN